MKFQLIFLIAICCLLGQRSTSVEAQSHNVTWGMRGLRDYQISHQVVYQKSRFLRKITDDYVFDQKTIPNPRLITQVVVTDQYTNGKGGFATLTSGGPNSHFVKIHLTSQRGHGYNFIIDIYGM